MGMSTVKSQHQIPEYATSFFKALLKCYLWCRWMMMSTFSQGKTEEQSNVHWDTGVMIQHVTPELLAISSVLWPGFISWNKQVQMQRWRDVSFYLRSRTTKQLIERRLAPTCTSVLSQQRAWWCNALKTTIILLSSNMYRLVTRILTAAGCRDARMNTTGKANPNL